MTPTVTPTTDQELDRAVDALRTGASKWQIQSFDRRIEIVDQCIQRVADVADDWVNAACEAKRIDLRGPLRSEELTTGPVSTLRFLQLIKQTFCAVRDHGKPSVPIVRHEGGQCRVTVMPTPLLFDSILFRPLKIETWLSPDVSIDHLHDHSLARLSGKGCHGEVEVVLGAGNVSSIPATDALTKILIENRAVILKMNPVNEYLGPFFTSAFAPLVDANMLHVVYGGIHQGKYLIDHDATTSIHITGSIHSHDAIVWGTDDQRESRRERGETVIDKTITSELGSVSPWAIVPGTYTKKELRFQAEIIAASVTNNVSFNCIATKLLLMCRGWPQREQFSAMLNDILQKTPMRSAYYPGAADRFETFSGVCPDDPDRLPWTILPDVNPSASPRLFCEESFAPVCGEVLLDAESDVDFLAQATDMMNDQIWGTLAASFTLSLIHISEPTRPY